MEDILILNALIINEGKELEADVLIRDGFIQKIEPNLSHLSIKKTIDASGCYLLPGAIDDQVHFREPGLTHKGEIYTEAKAAVAGGITSYMEMPNTIPNATTYDLLEDKYSIASKNSLANYSFYMGGTNSNLSTLLAVDRQNVCGVKLFMGSSTGNMLVDDPKVLDNIFANVPSLIATHCEDTPTILANEAKFREKYGEDVPISEHPLIRSREACLKSSSMAVELAKKHGTRLHVLHISTAEETQLFDNRLPLSEKRITAEACIHHLWFSSADYQEKGTHIKWNPAVKEASDRTAILQAVLEDRIDVIATDHAPHTLEEKNQPYFKAPSGGPLAQHSLLAMFDLAAAGKISKLKIVEKLSHNPAILFEVDRRGFLREGYWADLVIVNPKKQTAVSPNSLLYKCGWSPFTGHVFSTAITHTIVSGHLAYENGRFNESVKGKRLRFDRKP